MSTYSYSKFQLNKRNRPVVPFWNSNKIALTIGASGVVFFSLWVALTSKQPASVEVAQPIPVVVAQPTPVIQSKPEPYNCVINGTRYSYDKVMCDKEIAATWENFDPHSYAEEYKSALDVVAEKTKTNK